MLDFYTRQGVLFFFFSFFFFLLLRKFVRWSVGNYYFEILGFKHKTNQFFKFIYFLTSYGLSTIFLSCQKMLKPKRNFKYALWWFCEDNCMKTFPNFKRAFLSFLFPSLVLSFVSYISQILAKISTVLWRELVGLSKNMETTICPNYSLSLKAASHLANCNSVTFI